MSRFRPTTLALALLLLLLFSASMGAGAQQATELRFDFGPGPVEEDYIGVRCNTVYSASRGYGLLSSVDGRDRSQQLSATRRDFCNHQTSIRFRVDLPNGTYQVGFVAGDDIASQAAMTLRVENQTVFANRSASAGSYITEEFIVRVADGSLDVEVTGTNTVRINALTIAPAWVFQVPRQGRRPYDPQVGHGWEGDVFVADMPNGSYKVVPTFAGRNLPWNREPIEVTDGVLRLDFTGVAALVSELVIVREVGEPEVSWPVESGVQVRDLGSSVTITNSEISLTLTKSNGRIPTLIKRGKYQTSNLLSAQGGYYHLNYGVNGNKREYGGGGMSYRLIAASDERVEVAVSTTNPSTLPFELEYRYVVEADTPGFYVYSIFRYPERMPSGLAIEQSRYSFRANPSIFTQFGIEDDHAGDRFGTFPAASAIRSGTNLMDATTRLANGQVYTKYNHAVFVGDNRVNSLFGPGISLSIIRPSDEYLVGGPAKQEYFVEQTTTTPMLHWYEQVRHYGVPDVIPPKGWEKVYGPFFVYVTEGDSIEAMWADIKRRTDEEVAKWPYAWLDHPLYGAADRTEVTGRLDLTDGSSAEGAWVILGQPGLDPYVQNLDYLYYSRADEQGRFRIPAVRPGEYSLYAYVDGVFGQFEMSGIHVPGGQPVNLGTIEWTPHSHGELVWQIGTPDRTPREFRHGDELRQWGLWLRYPLEFPGDVDFVIGTSDERTDWNYFHPNIKTPGNPAHLLVPRDAAPAVWRIRFAMDEAVRGEAVLTIAIAASSQGTLRVNLNGKDIYTALSSISPLSNDAALYRSGEAGFYHLLEIPFDAALLRTGENVITLSHAAQLSGSTVGIMYDALKLEVKRDK